MTTAVQSFLLYACSFFASGNLIGLWKILNHVHYGAPLTGAGYEQAQSFSTSRRTKTQINQESPKTCLHSK